MINYRDFTTDSIRYNNLQTWVNSKLKKELGIRWVPILDPAMATDAENYEAYERSSPDMYSRFYKTCHVMKPVF